jgi:Ca2+-binding RTX toxin-like protein
LGGDDQIYGGDGRDHIIGGTGDDILAGFGGNDLIEGGEGNEVAYGMLGNDLMYGDSRISVSAAVALGNTQESSPDEGDFLQGNEGDDTIVGTARRDVLSGGSGSDIIVGGAGDDYIGGDRSYNHLGQRDPWIPETGQTGELMFAAIRELTDGPDGPQVQYLLDGFWLDPSDTGPGGADRIYAGAGNDDVIAGAGDDFVSGDNGSVLGTGQVTAADMAAGVEVNGHSLSGYLGSAFMRLFGTQAHVTHATSFNSAGFLSSSEQTNYLASNGINVATNSFWLIQEGQRVSLFNNAKHNRFAFRGLAGTSVANDRVYTCAA